VVFVALARKQITTLCAGAIMDISIAQNAYTTLPKPELIGRVATVTRMRGMYA